ncbi:MAG: heavy metal-binding protein [Halothiobacillus sp. 15-55-196]|jgi:copper chaperone|uniref:CopZ family metallochaperone n=1 Tax=Halothiobacillus sp. 15-55-196 TaxID=1970382 RepID=UPI000BC8BA1C|nr:cation transporter [Halothiobacillus sp. 15-55-196]OZB37586.1 MAG: heavy metal-binding protein [Halothiobacillus sp. 15-55-196]OZB77442.1 MAG: heavy metal-binding protein [Halothiobacillus sp. 13-55-115]
MSEIKLKITGMTCEHCVRAVTKALKDVPGVTDVEVTLQPGSAVVHGEMDPADLISVVTREGYAAVIQN